jgi:hypothetical protein
MTIKTQGGKVVTKDGKVSCECCEEPGCCMYPAQALADGDYSASDLPDAVTVDGVSFNRSGTGYGDTTNGVILEGNVWAKYRNGVRSTRPCLIQGGVVDQFANTYAVSYGSISFANGGILQRTGLCSWSTGPCEWLGSFLTGWGATIFYGDPNDFEIYRYKWRIVFDEPFPPLIEEDDDGNLVLIEEAGCSGAGVFVKDGNQNTPVGSYDGGDPIVS